MKQNNELKKKTSRFKIRNKKWISTGYLRQNYVIILILMNVVTSIHDYRQLLEMLVKKKKFNDLDSRGTNIIVTLYIKKRLQNITRLCSK